MTQLRAALVDDSVAIRAGLPVIVPEVTFVSSFGDTQTFLDDRPEVDVVALDLRLATIHEKEQGALNGIQSLRKVVEAGYNVCVYTDERRRLVLAQCIQAGAHGVVHKSDPSNIVVDALTRVAKGERVITQSLVGLAEVIERRGGLPNLTDRQRQILTARAKGEPWGLIANRLFITEGVAREHMAAVAKKFTDFIGSTTPAELQQQLGIGPGDILDQ